MTESAAVRVAVAKATIGNDVVIVTKEQRPVKIAAGQPVELGVLFDFEESSPEREEFRFILDCQYGKVGSEDFHELPTAESRWTDHRMRHDSGEGVLTQHIEFDTPGMHEIRFVAKAGYIRQPWGKDKVTGHEEKEATGVVTVHVG